MKDCIVYEIAIALKNGGWHSSDRDELKQYYELTEQETVEIVNAMIHMEEIDGE